jgi:GABA(A) receptor-associated protein
MGPATAATLGAVAAYATTREDTAGVAARRVGAVGLQVADRAADKGLQAVDRAVDEGRKRLSEVDGNSIPQPLRPALRALQASSSISDDTLKKHSEEAQRMREKYPDRVPVVCERSPYSELPEIERKKFIVPGAMLCGEFKYIVHKHVAQAMGNSLGAEQTIYIFVNGISPKTSTPMSELYDKFHTADGFLYVRYGAENTLG